MNAEGDYRRIAVAKGLCAERSIAQSNAFLMIGTRAQITFDFTYCLSQKTRGTPFDHGTGYANEGEIVLRLLRPAHPQPAASIQLAMRTLNDPAAGPLGSLPLNASNTPASAHSWNRRCADLLEQMPVALSAFHWAPVRKKKIVFIAALSLTRGR